MIRFLLHLLFAKQYAGQSFDIPLMYNLVLWNNFLKKKKSLTPDPCGFLRMVQTKTKCQLPQCWKNST